MFPRRFYPSSAVSLVVSGFVVHQLMATAIPCFWCVPNLTLASMVIAISMAPHRWFLSSILAGLLASLWAVRHAEVVFLNFFVLGYILRLLAQRWDLTDTRISIACCSLATSLFCLESLWLEGVRFVYSLGYVAGHIALTSVSAFLIQRIRSVTNPGGVRYVSKT